MKGDAMRTRSMALPSLLAIRCARLRAAACPAMVVTGRGLAEVYVDVAGATSLKPGQRLRLGAPPAVVAELEVVRIREGVAVCRIVSQRRTIVKGDIVTAVDVPWCGGEPVRPPTAAYRPCRPSPTPSLRLFPQRFRSPSPSSRANGADAPLLAVQALPESGWPL